MISKKSPNVYKSCPKMISIEKLKFLTQLQKIPKNVRDFGLIFDDNGFEQLPNISHILVTLSRQGKRIPIFF